MNGVGSEGTVREDCEAKSVPSETATDETSGAGPTPTENETPPSADEDPITTASRQKAQSYQIPTSAEKTFSLLFLGPSLYTLAAVLPGSVSGWGEESAEVRETVQKQLLPSLLQVAACTALQYLTRRLAYIVTAQYMSRVSPQVTNQSLSPPITTYRLVLFLCR